MLLGYTCRRSFTSWRGLCSFFATPPPPQLSQFCDSFASTRHPTTTATSSSRPKIATNSCIIAQQECHSSQQHESIARFAKSTVMQRLWDSDHAPASTAAAAPTSLTLSQPLRPIAPCHSFRQPALRRGRNYRVVTNTAEQPQSRPTSSSQPPLLGTSSPAFAPTTPPIYQRNWPQRCKSAR